MGSGGVKHLKRHFNLVFHLLTLGFNHLLLLLAVSNLVTHAFQVSRDVLELFHDLECLQLYHMSFYVGMVVV